MKTLAELAESRDKMQKNVILREGHGTIRVIVGMGTCGIAAGARNVMTAFTEEITKRKLEELETNHDLKLTYEEINKLAESKKVTTTMSTEDVTEYKPYTSTYNF